MHVVETALNQVVRRKNPQQPDHLSKIISFLFENSSQEDLLYDPQLLVELNLPAPSHLSPPFGKVFIPFFPFSSF